jgi:prepilin-type N-terminal cleavage/methylation domain-containing protein
MKTKEAGFTLIELMIVIVTVGAVLFGIAEVFVAFHFIHKFW